MPKYVDLTIKMPPNYGTETVVLRNVSYIGRIQLAYSVWKIYHSKQWLFGDACGVTLPSANVICVYGSTLEEAILTLVHEVLHAAQFSMRVDSTLEVLLQGKHDNVQQLVDGIQELISAVLEGPITHYFQFYHTKLVKKLERIYHADNTKHG